MSAKGGAAVTYSPEQWDDIADRAARMFVEEMREAAGGIEGLINLPLATVTTITGLSRQTIPKRMDVVDHDGKLCVTLATLRAYQERNTRRVKITPLEVLPPVNRRRAGSPRRSGRR